MRRERTGSPAVRPRVMAMVGAVVVMLLALASPASASPAARVPAAAGGSGAAAAMPVETGCPRGPDVYDIGIGDTGTAVREVQCLLNITLSWSAYPHVIAEDGDYGPITAGAVRVFQTCANNRGAGIAVDGRVGPETLPHLRWWGQHSRDTGELMC